MFDASLSVSVAVLLVFAVAFAESLIIVGFFVPGWMLLLAAGGMVGAGHWPFWPVLLAAYAGAVLGEGLGFALGHGNSARVRNSRFFARHVDLLQRAEAFFRRWGMWALVAGRFIGPVRAVLPFVAGVLQFSWRRYVPINVLTALIWAPAYLLPGMLVGAATQLAWTALLPLAAALVSIALLLWAAWRWRGQRRMALAFAITALLSVLALPLLPGRDAWGVLWSALAALI